MSVPVMSIGIKSGVNWIRLNLSDIVSASLLTSSVLASPGTPISKAWPRANRQIASRSTTSCWPTITRPISFRSRAVDFPQVVDRLNVVLAQSLLRVRGHRLRHEMTPEVGIHDPEDQTVPDSAVLPASLDKSQRISVIDVTTPR